MGIVVDTHQHISCEVPGRKYFPWQHTRHILMNWAYGGLAPKQGMPPYTRDPNALMERQGLRIADPEGERTIKDMDDAGVDVAVLLPLDYDFSWGSTSDFTIEEKHQHLARMQEKYPTRFVGLAGPDPRRPGVVEIFDRAIKEHHLRGLKLIPKAGYYAWDERLFPLYERCLDYDLPVAVCTEPDGGGYNRDRFAQPVHLADVVAEYPDLKLVVLHAGAPLYHWLEETINAVARNTNAVLSLDTWVRGATQAPGLCPDFVNNEEAVVRLISRLRDVLGAHRIMWGTDSHHGSGANGGKLWGRAVGFGETEMVMWLKRLPETAAKYNIGFSQEETDLIMGDNAARVFDIKSYPEWERPAKYDWRRRLPPPFKGTMG